MKKIILLLIAFVFVNNIIAQVGVGTTLPNESTQLEVVSNDKGVLLPQVALTSTTDATTISNGNVESLLVYNTATINDVTPGYYYWYNNKWQRISSSEDIASLTETVTTLVDNGNGTITYSDEDGSANTINLSTAVDAVETLTTLVDNGNGSITYTDEDGSANSINLSTAVDAVETLTTLVDNGNGSITYEWCQQKVNF